MSTVAPNPECRSEEWPLKGREIHLSESWKKDDHRDYDALPPANVVESGWKKVSLELCDRVSEEINRRIVADFPDMRTSSAAEEEPTGTGNALVMSVFKVPQRGKWDHFADYAIRCWQTGPGRYAIEIYCEVTIIEPGGEATRVGHGKIKRILREYRPLGIAGSETTRYRSGIRQLGEEENEIVSRRCVEFRFKGIRVEQRLDRVEKGRSTIDDIGELALATLRAMEKIRGTS